MALTTLNYYIITMKQMQIVLLEKLKYVERVKKFYIHYSKKRKLD